MRNREIDREIVSECAFVRERERDRQTDRQRQRPRQKEREREPNVHIQG